MELVLRILNACLDAFAAAVNFAGDKVQKVAAAFDLQVSRVPAQFVGGIFVIIVILFVLQRILWGGGGLRMFRPQAVVHLTNRTPFQVVMDDLGRILLAFVVLAALVVVAVVLFGGPRTTWTYQ